MLVQNLFRENYIKLEENSVRSIQVGEEKGFKKVGGLLLGRSFTPKM